MSEDYPFSCCQQQHQPSVNARPPDDVIVTSVAINSHCCT